MMQARRGRLIFSLVTLALVLASVSRINAEVIVFANGRTMSVKDYQVSGHTITVTLKSGGQATFERALVAALIPDELAQPDATLIPVTASVNMVGAVARPALSARPFAAIIESVALEHGIDPALVHAVIQAESNYRPKARSHVGARGLMQVMPATARDLGVMSASQLFDPQQNIEAGVKYLKAMLERFDGDLPTAIAAYNAGPTAVSKHDGIPPYAETQKYVRKVLSNFQQ
jgi:soluble lytic murein transglycosylase-like protein